ncbi:hypothetical protein evm_002316 [Chilo suppressalis]|nr:hypothetical protein evm_002316 [Chilo suppressalis]
MAKWTIVLAIFFFNHSSATSITEKLPREEFSKFPLFRHLDRFTPCVELKGGAYCSTNFHLVAAGHNELYEKIENITTSAVRHYNYRNPHYGYCVTQRCKQFYKGDSDLELLEAMGACLNHTLEREYGLRARINYSTCYRHGERKHRVTWLDCAAAVFFLTIFASVVAGTSYDIFATNKDPNCYLTCFSLPANWAQLKAPWPSDKMTARLVGINGMRAITSIMVVYTHAALGIGLTLENPYELEQIMESFSFRLMGHTHIVMQTFFVFSGMFMTYSLQISNERNPLTLRSLPKAIFFRWYRLAPVYLATILFSATWYKFLPYGPFWQELVNDEVHDCQAHWSSMFFFYSNYQYGSQCNPHHWSTALDFHMHILGLLVMLIPSEKMRNTALFLLCAIGIVVPGIEVYLRDIDGVILPSGKTMQSLRTFDKYEVFNYIHKRTHNNIPVFIIGMAFGLFLYKFMKNPVDTTKYKKYAPLYWLTFPLMMGMLSQHSYVFLKEGGRPSLPTRLFFAMVPKTLWGLLILTIVFGMICKVENIYRRILEWPGWVSLVRLTYCTYNVHMTIIRWLYAEDTQLTFVSELSLVCSIPISEKRFSITFFEKKNPTTLPI